MSTGERVGAARGERIRPSFELSDQVLNIFDPIERRQIELEMDGSPAPRPVDPAAFRAPVDAGVILESTTITVPQAVNVVIRDTDGEMVVQTGVFADETTPDGEYSIEIAAAVKLYLQVESEVSVYADAERTKIEFDGLREVLVGARSRHARPAATMTVDGSPKDAMAAITAFGSALKTASPERSYPTLRGHLPLVELGESLDIPQILEMPANGITVEVPPEYEYIYPAAPLTFYLGADMRAGDEPLLRTSEGFVHQLDTLESYERSIERVLKHVFLLDCVSRTEGLYPVDLFERSALEERISVDLNNLYNLPPAERLRAYLEIPHDPVEDLVPEWRQITHVDPAPTAIEVLPFVVNDLAIVRTPGRNPSVPVEEQEAAVEEFLRGGEGEVAPVSRGVTPDEDTTVEQIWVGQGQTQSANEATLSAFYNRLDREPATGPIDVTVVSNDAKMRDEERDVVDEVYGTRERFPLAVTVRRNLTTAELRETLAENQDFLHYIGHIDESGIRCADGRLDAATLESVGVDAFLLNACQSYQQGLSLVQRGSIGGVVTHSDVINRGAVTVGSTLARLLNRGFPLRAALSVARHASVIGNQYVVVGDGSLSISQPEGAPNSCRIRRDGDKFHVTIETYTGGDWNLGSIVKPLIEREDHFYLVSSNHIKYTLDRQEIEDFLSLENVPLRYEGELYWSNEVDVSDF